MLRQLLASTLVAASLLSFAPDAHAETISQCRERAYRYYNHLVDTGTREAEARKVLNGDLRRCNAR